jgi:hypothetical protein
MMVTNVDEAIPEAALAEIRSAPAIDDAYIVSLPPFDGDPDPVALQSITAIAAK